MRPVQRRLARLQSFLQRLELGLQALVGTPDRFEFGTTALGALVRLGKRLLQRRHLRRELLPHAFERFDAFCQSIPIPNRFLERCLEGFDAFGRLRAGAFERVLLRGELFLQRLDPFQPGRAFRASGVTFAAQRFQGLAQGCLVAAQGLEARLQGLDPAPGFRFRLCQLPLQRFPRLGQRCLPRLGCLAGLACLAERRLEFADPRLGLLPRLGLGTTGLGEFRLQALEPGCQRCALRFGLCQRRPGVLERLFELRDALGAFGRLAAKGL